MEKADVREVPGELKKKEQHDTKRKLNQSGHVFRQGAGGFRCSKRPLSFQVSDDQKDGLNNASAAVNALEKRVHLLNLIIRRNRNQHRSQLFFKHLCLLRTSLAKLLSVSSQLSGLSQAATSARTAEQVRHNFEIEASLRSQKEVLEEHVREVLVPKCYVTFTGLVADSQFGNLGIVVVALLSEIVCGAEGVGSLKELQAEEEEYGLGGNRHGEGAEQGVLPDWSRSLIVKSTRATGEDQGEIVERVYDRDVDGKGDDANAEFAMKASRAVAGQSLPDWSSREGTPQEEVESIYSHALTRVEAAVRAGDVKQISMKATKEGKDGGENVRRTKKNKKSKSAIDDLFSGLL